jgi:hypothetical protein
MILGNDRYGKNNGYIGDGGFTLLRRSFYLDIKD